MRIPFIFIFCLLFSAGKAQEFAISNYDVLWNSQSKNSSESMPVGGGDIGLNVWVEDGDLLFYISRSGLFDENNTLLKVGRVRLRFPQNKLKEGFKQRLNLADGACYISGAQSGLKSDVRIWVDVHKAVIHIDIDHSKATNAQLFFENWRFEDRATKKKENNQNSWKWAPQGDVKTYADEVGFENGGVYFYHQNKKQTVFDVVVKQQGLESIKDSLFNQLDGRIFGGFLYAKGFVKAGIEEGNYINTPFKAYELKTAKPSKRQQVLIALQTGQHLSPEKLKSETQKLALNSASSAKKDFKNNQRWWASFWNKSYIQIPKTADTTAYQVARNYNLFRYMLACNAYGDYPTKFNGGLFTFDPVFTDSTATFTPDFRNWGGGTHTAQNQRLVYWPMLKAGDADLMKPQFDFYQSILGNAEWRSKFYWGHNGASFTEQIENFGLPNPAEYGWKRPESYDKGMEYNAWLEYEWDTVLEFCQMILDARDYQNFDVKPYLPLIKSSLRFFDEHYQYLAKKRGAKALTADGKLVIYPGSAAETYKMAYNASSTVAALKTVLQNLLQLPNYLLNADEKTQWQAMLTRIPEISYRDIDGKTTISPATVWERINNVETPQLYPVFPWKIFGLQKPGLDTAINTYKFDPDALRFRDSKGWKQDNIWAARLGLTDEAVKYTFAKLKNSERRFPAFWGPGFDWTPDHNWGGSGMIGLQEMLLQDVDDKILLFPAWPKDIDVRFKLHAPQQTIVEAEVKNGKANIINVWPESRRKDIIIK
ncbi:DUF5703 domain-containing protein [Pelobium manganitolerans]|uniref:DUF5703 domain-containing protein n=1 Tax=Pelobium manganitolerans TaxID=1842495 RepID=UPI003FA376FC